MAVLIYQRVFFLFHDYVVSSRFQPLFPRDFFQKRRIVDDKSRHGKLLHSCDENNWKEKLSNRYDSLERSGIRKCRSITGSAIIFRVFCF